MHMSVTSPDQIHHQTASVITENLQADGYQATVKNTEGHQVFTQTPELKRIGAEPGSGDFSAQDAIRVITEDLQDSSAGHYRMVGGKGARGIRMLIKRKLGLKA